MGFFDIVKNIASEVSKTAQKTNEERKRKEEKFSSLSDEELKEKFRKGNLADKMAASKLLKERGYKKN